MAGRTATEIPNKEAKRQIARFRERVEAEVEELHLQYLNIMPMMDMMTILLVFLLKQFSLQASAMSMAEMTLPTSSSEKASVESLKIMITQNAIIVEGDAIAPLLNHAVDPSMKRDGANGYYITPLVDILTKHANRLKKMALMGGADFDHAAMIMVDKNTPYRLLSEVMYSAGQAEFLNYRFVVIKRSQ